MPASTKLFSSRVRAVGQLALLTVLWAAQTGALAQVDANSEQLRRSFLNPPDDCRIMMRWWWFGPAVSKREIQRELEQMKAEGIGGVEIANLYPQSLNDPATGFHNQSFLSDEHIEMIRYAAQQARALGLRVDITLGSGWPLGGPHIPLTEAAGLLRVETVKIPDQAASIAAPSVSAGERLLATFLVPDAGESLNMAKAEPITAIGQPRLQLPATLVGEHSAIFFIASRTGMMVKRPSIGAAGFVLDHYDRAATDAHIHAVGDRLLQAFGDHPPYAVFSDSLEDYGSNWTGDLLAEFHKRRGYNLTPYLPALVGDMGPKTEAVRHDWGRTLTEMANERFLIPLHEWAQQNHTLFRSQTYGSPPVTLSSNQYADLPEGEGESDLLMWRHFSDTRWAASAGHLFGNNVISSETWTWLHSPAFRATPLDMKAEADLHFLQGINQLIGHGWPYSPPSAEEPGWRMYAAAALNDHNPWSFVMPDLTKYLQRVSYALRQGKPANDVAILLPNDDAWAKFRSDAHSASAVTTALGFNTAGKVFSMNEAMGGLLGETVIAQVLDAGLNFDFIDADAIDKVGTTYPALILPNVDRLPLATYKKIAEYAHHGGIVIATRQPPSTAPGLVNADRETEEIGQVSKELFQTANARGHLVQDENELGGLLKQLMKPDVTFSEPAPEIGFIHRTLPAGDLYFLVNTSNQPRRVQASFRSTHRSAELWDAMTGSVSHAADPRHVGLNLQPYESRLVYLSDGAMRVEVPLTDRRLDPVQVDLSSDWTLTFKTLNRGMKSTDLHSWSDDEISRYYSGPVGYEKTFRLDSSQLQPGQRLLLDFGEATTVKIPSPLGPHSMRAYLESPVREAAEVYVNGHRAGSVWHPPYSVEVDQFLVVGKNDLKIIVGNTAINSLAGQSAPDYRLLKARYGDLFSPQDMENLAPLPSGILGGVKLTSTDAH